MNDASADDRIQRRLGDLAAFGEQAAYIADKGRDAYLAESPGGALLRNAGERILIKVATVVEKLPQEFKDRHPSVDWSGITRMRNLVAHHYDKVNDDLVWAALTTRLPGLLAELGLSAR